MEEGRRIYDNIRKAIQFLLSSNLAEVLTVFSAALMGFTVLKPSHLLWVNLITDSFPALALGMEAAEADTMRRPPRRSDEGIFSGGMGPDVFFQGVVITVLTLASYLIGRFMEAGQFGPADSPTGMTMAFLTLSLVEILHAFNMRSRRQSVFAIPHQNKWLWLSTAASLALTLSVVFIPGLASFFGFRIISAAAAAAAAGLAVLVVPIMELYKLVCRKASAR